MSGGSFEYLCYKSADTGDIFEHEHNLEHMIDALAELGYAKDAARETAELLMVMRQAKVRIEVMADRLHHVWHAMEWWKSMDGGEDDLKAALAKYRSE